MRNKVEVQRPPVSVLPVMVRADIIEANPWNANKQSDFMFAQEKASIVEFGFIDPCTVREHPTKKGMLQMLDGEHRWKGAVELGIEEIPVTNLGVISDAKAKAITDIFNNLRGEQDPVLRAQLLKSVIDEDARLRAVLPYGDDELQSILAAATFDWDALGTENKTKKDGSKPDDGETGWVGLKVSLTPAQHKTVSSAIERAKKKLSTTSDAEALTAICKAFPR
jgi:hypothetical protein